MLHAIIFLCVQVGHTALDVAQRDGKADIARLLSVREYFALYLRTLIRMHLHLS